MFSVRVQKFLASFYHYFVFVSFHFIVTHLYNFCYRNQVDQKNNVGDGKNNGEGGNAADKKKPHIKKPLNAFMLYMKEMRAKVVAECTLKESAAINQILGRRVRKLYYVFCVAFVRLRMRKSR